MKKFKKALDKLENIWYNPFVNESGRVDEAQTNRLVKLVEWLRQHGKTAHKLLYEICKGENIMSVVDIVSKIEQLRELEELIKEAEAEAEALKGEIKAEMMLRDTEEMEVGRYIVRWTSVLSNRFDSTAFKKVMPDVYKAYVKQVGSRKFTISG